MTAANQPEPSLREQVTKYVAALASSGNNFVVEGEQSPISDEVKEGYVDSLVDILLIVLNQAISKTIRAAEELAYEQREAVVREAKIQGMQSAKSRVLRRTEIPKDAKNPTRDHIVVLGEHIADIIQQDIDELTHPQAGESEGK